MTAKLRNRPRWSVLSLCAAQVAVLAFATCTLPPVSPEGAQSRPRRQATVRIPDDERRLPTRSADPQADIRRLEGLLAVEPRAQLELSQLHFQLAQDALEKGDESEYASQLARAQEYLLDYIELSPRDAPAQNQLGILAAYRGDFDGSRRSFRIATQLDPVDPVAQLNLAELAVYAGKLPEARKWLQLARSRGADEIDAKLVEVLMLWKERDLIAAKERFELARGISPGRVQGWNGATTIQSFEDMAAHCCRLTFCGPFMEQACGDMNQAVAQQSLTEATILKELQLEIERARRIRELYERRRDLKIEVDEDSTDEQQTEPR
jgi:tetratricopeptide (TPR) repeat protein